MSRGQDAKSLLKLFAAFLGGLKRSMLSRSCALAKPPSRRAEGPRAAAHLCSRPSEGEGPRASAPPLPRPSEGRRSGLAPGRRTA
eukprot:5193303-Pyramimonas_sp.AAC.1